MSILVTGGAGFIGSHVCEALLKKGEDVVIVDDLNDYYDPKHKKANLELLKQAKFYELDITNDTALAKVFEQNQIDKVVHLAARAGVRASLENPMLYTQVNVFGTANVLEQCRKHKAKLVFGGSSSVYGMNTKVPFSEDDRIDKEISPYATTKKLGEVQCEQYSRIYGVNIVCLRFFTVYGPRGRPDMAPRKFAEKIMRGEQIEMYGDGTSKRDYTFVADIVDGVLAALDLDARFEIINLGNSNPIELKQFISTIEDNVGKKAKVVQKGMQQGDVVVTYADISKAKRLLGYSPKVKFEDGMKIFVDWLKAQK